MGEILNRVTLVSDLRRVLQIAAALIVLSVVPFLAHAQQQDTDLPAEDIIQILEENPDVLADAKAEIVTQLQDRGYSVTEKEITDERLFNQIRTDDRVRHVMSDQLKQRGFGGDQNEQQPTNPPSGTAGGGVPNGQNRAALPLPTPTPRPQPSPAPRQGAGGPPSTQEQYPLRNLPAVRDLYTQAVNAPATLERFGAA